MGNFDYQFGLTTCLFIAKSVFGLLTVYTLGKKINIFISVNYILLIVSLAFCLFCALFPIINLSQLFMGSLEWRQLGEFAYKEIANGILPLRITSIITSYYFMFFLFKLLRNIENEEENFLYQKITLQYSFYLIVMCVLWYSAINGHVSAPFILLNWGLFYIIDDYKLISDYQFQFQSELIRLNPKKYDHGEMPSLIIKSHTRKVLFFDIFLLITLLTGLVSLSFGRLESSYLPLYFFNFGLINLFTRRNLSVPFSINFGIGLPL